MSVCTGTYPRKQLLALLNPSSHPMTRFNQLLLLIHCTGERKPRQHLRYANKPVAGISEDTA